MEPVTHVTSQELYKISLQTFFMNVENNHYDSVSNRIIEELENNVSELETQIETDKKQAGYMKPMQVYFLKEELLAISEMKIIYQYKHFETYLKLLLKFSYPTIDKRNLSHWDQIGLTLKTKKIDLEKLSNYNEINELRNLNNSIKHSTSNLNSTTQNIREFKNKKVLVYKDLLNFYSRISESSLNFLKSLSFAIEKDLFEYDNNRLEELSNELISKMDKRTVNQLITKLKTRIE